MQKNIYIFDQKLLNINILKSLERKENFYKIKYQFEISEFEWNFSKSIITQMKHWDIKIIVKLYINLYTRY